MIMIESTIYKLTNDPWQKFDLNIDGNKVSFDVYWVEVAQGWFFDAYDAVASNPIIKGEKVVVGTNYAEYFGVSSFAMYLMPLKTYEKPIDPLRYGFETMALNIVTGLPNG